MFKCKTALLISDDTQYSVCALLNLSSSFSKADNICSITRGRWELNMGDLIQAHSQDIFEMDKKVNELAYEVEKAKKSFAWK